MLIYHMMLYSLTIIFMSVASSKAAIPETLESSFEHVILHEGEVQFHLPDFVLRNLKHSCVCSELTKQAILGCGPGAFWLAQRLQ